MEPRTPAPCRLLARFDRLDRFIWATSLTALFRALSDAVESGTPFLHYWPTTTKDESGRAHLAWQIRP
ncbi:hypothetical protein [Streptomyces sp. MBT49]|uniref:hypothetical protein n=1 Tax=Streptomyces sp. MBT49 TaxID=1488380 RepID=UPI001F3344F0|nr:hypothetical protein [Streptomyces sp. MBT49]